MKIWRQSSVNFSQISSSDAQKLGWLEYQLHVFNWKHKIVLFCIELWQPGSKDLTFLLPREKFKDPCNFNR